MEAEETMTILSYSYYDLPPHLRTCLLYLSTYPEDYPIEKNSLIWKWIAEGFIDGKQGERSFELGERYFNDLVNRSLIQAVEGWDGIVSLCRVHDMVLDLTRQLSFEENFISILGDNVEGTSVPNNVRRLTHQNRTAEHINSEAIVNSMPKVRSYTAFINSIDCGDQFLRFKLLRVLDIVGFKFKEDCCLQLLGDLLHLRFLRIRCKNLPKQIGNLKLLQTLAVDGMLPAGIVHLIELVRLYALNKVPDGISLLVCLEELRIKNLCSDNPKRFVKELGSLRELRVLEFSTDRMDESMQREFVNSLSNLLKIQYIRVAGWGWGWNADTDIWEAAGFVLPRPLQYLDWSPIKFSKLLPCINPSHLPNLSHLRLAVTTMDEQELMLLARLPALCLLYLETESTVTASNINASDGCCFQKLRYFEVSKMVYFEQPNEEDAKISLHIWNEKDTMPFSSRKIHGSSKIVPYAVMPNLEVLEFSVPLRALKDNIVECDNIGLEYLPSLCAVNGRIDCYGVCADEVDSVLAALRKTCKVHPNHPKLGMFKVNEGKAKTVSTHDEENKKQQQEAEIDSLAVNMDLGKQSPACY